MSTNTYSLARVADTAETIDRYAADVCDADTTTGADARYARAAAVVLRAVLRHDLMLGRRANLAGLYHALLDDPTSFALAASRGDMLAKRFFPGVVGRRDECVIDAEGAHILAALEAKLRGKTLG